jgi:hypothetical protein
MDWITPGMLEVRKAAHMFNLDTLKGGPCFRPCLSPSGPCTPQPGSHIETAAAFPDSLTNTAKSGCKSIPPLRILWQHCIDPANLLCVLMPPKQRKLHINNTCIPYVELSMVKGGLAGTHVKLVAVDGDSIPHVGKLHRILPRNRTDQQGCRKKYCCLLLRHRRLRQLQTKIPSRFVSSRLPFPLLWKPPAPDGSD